jgi:hypothetical protein
MCLIFNERLGWALPNRIDGSPLQGEDAGTAFGWCLIGAKILSKRFELGFAQLY